MVRNGKRDEFGPGSANGTVVTIPESTPGWNLVLIKHVSR
jgi:hypothetical protein